MMEEIEPSKFFNKTQSESPPLVMLAPDHPLMMRYQAVLKAHLLRQKEKLAEELYEMKVELKKCKDEEEALEVTIFDAKRDIDEQRKMINDQQIRLEELMTEKHELNRKLQEMKETVKAEKLKVQKSEEKERELNYELTKYQALENQFRIWKDEADAELAVKQRISEKSEIEKRELGEEQRKIDLYILRVMSEISKGESERDILDREIAVRTGEKDILNQTLADASADLQSLTDDYKRLMSDWKSVLSAMSRRDAVYADVLKEFNSTQDSFKQLNIEIESYKKSSAEEMNRSGELGHLIMRTKEDSENYKRQIKTLSKRKDDLEKDLCNLNAVARQVERDLQIAKTERALKDTELTKVQKDLEKLQEEKRDLEEKTLQNLLHQATNDKAAMNLNKQIKNVRQEISDMEIKSAELENKIAKLRRETSNKGEILKELHKDLDEREAEITKIEAEIRAIHIKIKLGQSNLLVVKKKVQDTEESQKNRESEFNLKQRIDDLEYKIKETYKKNSELQNNWLQQQNQNVKLNQQKNEHLKEIATSRKQIQILDQKNIRLENEIEKERKLHLNLTKNMAHLQQKLLSENAMLSETLRQRNLLDKDLLLAQSQLIQNLKESEMEQLSLKSEIKDLENAVEDLEGQMLETQKEMLAWEKKIKMIVETKNMIKKEHSEEGEIGQMRQEIHRMEVRMGYLNKVQEQLMAELEQTVTRRENIIRVADAKGKQSEKNKGKNLPLRKIEEMNRKLTKTRQERKTLEKLIAETTSANEDMSNELKEKSDHLAKWENELKNLQDQLDEGYLKKQHNLEILVRRQRKCKYYEDFKNARYKLLHRSESQLESEMFKAKTINSDLSCIVETLINDFPNHKILFKKIQNTLKPDLL